MGHHLERVAAFWDEHVAGWMAGGEFAPPPLDRWFPSYAGKGMGKVSRDGLTEPYLGDLFGTPSVVILGLNPGGFQPEFQSRTGIFADEIASSGGYTAWAATAPYHRPPWTDRMGRNRYHAARLTFTGRVSGIEAPDPNDVLIFELYPWHSVGITGRMSPPPDLIERFVWQPISELPVSDVYAFGREWDNLVIGLGLRQIAALGRGGSHYGSSVANRAVRIYGLPSGQHLVVEWHSGGAGPPNAPETRRMCDAVRQWTTTH